MPVAFPSRAVKGFNVTHTFLNQYLRDNLNGLHWLGAYQTSDLVKNSDATLADCPGMAIPVASGDVWAVFANSFCISNPSADIKLTLTAPGGSTGRFGILGGGQGLTALSSTTFGTGLAMSISGVLATNVMLFGHVTAGAAGAIQLQGAQNTSFAVDTEFRKYSPILGFRISGPANSPIPDFSANQVLTAANLETYLRDGLNNLYFVSGHLEEAVEAINTEVPIDLTGMRFRVRAGEKWVWFSFIGYSSTTGVDIAMGASVPHGSVGKYGIIGYGVPIGAAHTGTLGSMVQTEVIGNTNQALCFNGTIIAGSDGDVQMTGSQSTAAGDTTTFLADSFFQAFRVPA